MKIITSLVFVSSLSTLLLSGCATNIDSSQPAYVGAKESVTGSRVPRREACALGVKTVSLAEVSLLQISGMSSNGSPAGQ